MNDGHHVNGVAVSEVRQFVSAPAAKARLMAWAENHDALKLKARSGTGALVARGGLALLAGVAIARLISPGRRVSPGAGGRGVGARVIRWAIVARAVTWLLPHAMTAVQSHLESRAPSRGSATPRL